jgi:hypothetical protein
MQEKSLIKKNILQYLEIKGISKYKFYQETGITRGILDQNNGMNEENTAKLLAYYSDISPEWLLTGKEPMLKKQDDSNINQSISGNNNNMAGSNSNITIEKSEISHLKEQLSEYKKELQSKNTQISDLLLEQKILHNQINKLIDKIK